MDEFMKEKITNQECEFFECEFFVGKSGYGDFVYYKIPGVSKYYLRHDGKIVDHHIQDMKYPNCLLVPTTSLVALQL